MMKRLITLLLGFAILPLAGCSQTSKETTKESDEMPVCTVCQEPPRTTTLVEDLLKPAEPEKPAAPETPAEPEKPAAPETPAEPEKPAAPETPAEPEKPAAPETPAEPEKPAIDPQLGDTGNKPKEIVDVIKGYKVKRAFDAAKNTAQKPKVYSTLPAEFHGPDGMAINPKTGTLFLSIPNFNRRPGDAGPKVHPAYIAKISPDGKAESILALDEIENIKVATGQIGPMGLAFGPDGHLYVCDNQYFFDTNNKSRILRVLMDGDAPTGKVEIVVDGTKLSNAILWHGDHLYLTDTFFDLEGEFGSGGVWRFTKDEILNAGSGENPPIKVNPIKQEGDDPHLLTLKKVAKIPGGGNGGPDGMTIDANGTIYFGFFGTGEMWRIVFDADGKPAVDLIHPAGEYFHCCDGIYYDKGTNKVYITDSASNAIHAFVPPAVTEKPVFETIWENGNTDGADGSLDQPCEAVVIGKKLIVVNFDWPFPELLNTASDDPATLSVIELE